MSQDPTPSSAVIPSGTPAPAIGASGSFGGVRYADEVEERFREAELGSDIDVRRVHGVLLRETAEPAEGSEPVPLWLMGIFGIMVLWAGIYLGLYSGGFRGDVFNPNTDFDPKSKGAPQGPPDPKVIGKKLFTANCVACHQSSGLGQAGQFPPLAGSEWVIGDAPNRLIGILLHGLQGPVQVKGATYNGAMAAWEGVFKDEQIAAILTYVRTDWGNNAPPISKEAVAAMRDKFKGQQGNPWSEAQLKAIPPDASILQLGGGAPAPAGQPAAAITPGTPAGPSPGGSGQAAGASAAPASSTKPNPPAPITPTPNPAEAQPAPGSGPGPAISSGQMNPPGVGSNTPAATPAPPPAPAPPQ